MSNVNSIHLIGNLVADPELRYTQSGKPVTSFRLAVNERINVNGDWRDRTTYINVVAWNSIAENAAVSLNKGDRVSVAGRLQIREYEPEAGTKQWFTEVIADDIAPSLRWAQLNGELERTHGRQSNGDRQPAGVGAGDGSDPVYGDEAPF